MLLTLLSLGVKNIRLGPKLPAFLTAEAVQVRLRACVHAHAGTNAHAGMHAHVRACMHTRA